MSDDLGESFPNRSHLLFALDAGRVGTWAWDARTGAVTWDTTMERLFGLEPGQFERDFVNFLDRVHPDDRESSATAIAHAQESGESLTFEHRVVWPDGSVHWIEGRGRAVTGDAGFSGMVGIGVDIDDRKHYEEIERESAAWRMNTELVRQLEDAERIAQIGSWRWLLEDDLVSLSTEMQRQLEATSPLTGAEFLDLLRARIHPDDASLLRGEDDRPSTMESFSYEHRIVVHGETRHVLHQGEVLHDDDGKVTGLRGTMQDVTERKRVVDRLVETRERLVQERRAVEVLHDTLIRPDFPDVDGVEIAARYLSAEVEAEVGGDWYDAFEMPDGRVMLAVGDVSGHGIRAARLMAKLRHSTRAYATITPAPAEVLAKLDRFLVHFGQPEEFATVLLAAFDPTNGELEFVSAGHPYPLVVGARGSEFVEEIEPCRIIGVDLSSFDVTVHRMKLEPGEALLFYTDGLVERRGASLAEHGPGEACLPSLALRDIGATADAVCEAAIDRCLRGLNRDDDVCVLAVMRRA
ncbi:MAG: SpoIIE family protein phosphatase [Acidimicrobiia bacterium]